MPSDKAKQKWNTAHYTQVKVSINPETAAAFKAACAATERSQASVISEFMMGYCKKHPEIHPVTPNNTLETRKKRRAAVKTLMMQLENILSEEERYFESVPENLRGNKWHEASESAMATLNDIIGLLSEVYD